MRILAVDLGLVRTGLAICDPNEILASPVGTLTEGNPQKVPALVAQKATELGAELIVVGYPKNMDGSSGESTVRARRFAEELQENFGFSVQLWDERMTTITAAGYLNEQDVRGKKRKEIIDTVSATVILQNFLDSRH